MGECCDICGDIGVAEAILTCRQCNKNQEHMYCMRVFILNAPAEGWLCEECERQLPRVPNSHLPVQSKVYRPVEFETATSSRGRSGPLNRVKRVKTGKTKYIPTEEAIMLSGSLGNHLPSPTRPKTGPNRFDKTPAKAKTAPMKSFHQKSSASGPSQQLKPKKVSFAGLPEKPTHQSRNLSELRSSTRNVVPAQAHCVSMQKKMSVQVKSPQANKGTLVRKRFSVAQPAVSSGGNGCTSMDQTSNNENINAVLPDIENSSYTPASLVVWKGSFNIKGGISHRKLNQEILAYPPSSVLEKVHKFSIRMPQLLGFDMVSRDNIWPKLFPDYSPDARDIALYLFPHHHQRSEDYIFLLEYITEQNYVLRVQIDDVEFLVFSSKLLPQTCQCWEGKNFLWGVFHQHKDAVSLSKTRRPALPIQHSDDANYNHNQDDEDSDMEIDMIAGVSVGRIDCVIQDDEDSDMEIDMIAGVSVGRIDCVNHELSRASHAIWGPCT